MTETDRKAVVLPFNLKPKAKRVMGFDGIERDIEQEDKLNSLFASVFQGPASERVLDYLEAITLRTVSPQGASEGDLRYREGMRFMASIVLERVRKGREK